MVEFLEKLTFSQWLVWGSLIALLVLVGIPFLWKYLNQTIDETFLNWTLWATITFGTIFAIGAIAVLSTR